MKQQKQLNYESNLNSKVSPVSRSTEKKEIKGISQGLRSFQRFYCSGSKKFSSVLGEIKETTDKTGHDLGLTIR